MEIVLAGMALDRPGGMQSYMLTIAPHLERLGNEVTLFAPETGLVARLARDRGLRVCGSEHELPDSCDAVISNDAPTALAMAERYPDAVRGLIVHSADLDVHLPPAHPGVVSFAVAMNAVAERRVRATVNPPETVRLRQPIDFGHLYPGTSLGARPERVLLLGNWLGGRARDEFTEVCERAGLSCRQVGFYGETTVDPRPRLLESDIVVGLGRSALDAMACGRAVWVAGQNAGDGWVTEDSYTALEADGFRGRGTDAVIDAAAFGRALEQYDARMGPVNRQLAVLHHSPYDHAVELVGLISQHDPIAPPPAPLREMARLVRTQFDAQTRVVGLFHELRAKHEELVASELERTRLERELERQTRVDSPT